MVYDITDLDSFNNLNTWLIEIEKNASKNVYKILIGNKNDLEKDRKVTYEQGKEFADQYGMKFIETSARDSKNVHEAFHTMTQDIVAQTHNKQISTKKPEDHQHLQQNKVQNINTGGCC